MSKKNKKCCCETYCCEHRSGCKKPCIPTEPCRESLREIKEEERKIRKWESIIKNKRTCITGLECRINNSRARINAMYKDCYRICDHCGDYYQGDLDCWCTCTRQAKFLDLGGGHNNQRFMNYCLDYCNKEEQRRRCGGFYRRGCGTVCGRGPCGCRGTRYG